MHNGISTLTAFPWGITSERAAMLVAEGHKTNPAMAQELGVSVAALKDWRAAPEFRERVKSIIEATQAQALESGVLNKIGRIAALMDVYQKLQQIVDERAVEGPVQWPLAPGISTGLVIHQFKSLGSGRNAREIDEFLVDQPMVTQLRDTLKQIAQETGQWVEKTDAAHTITKIEVVYADMEPKDL